MKGATDRATVPPQVHSHGAQRQVAGTFLLAPSLAEGSARRRHVAASANKSSASAQVAASVAVVVGLGVLNRLLYKMALVPMGSYAFFLSQLQCFGYVLVYFSFLFARYRAGIVTKEMLNCPKLPFVAVGFLEASCQLIQMLTAVRLPGALLPLLTQSSIIWNLLLSTLIVGQRYTAKQIGAAMVVMAGVILAGLPPKGLPGGTIEAVRPIDVTIFTLSMALISLAVILKEKIFKDAKARMGGKDLDVFVVNSTGSAFQALFVFLALPILTKLKGLSLAQLPDYLTEGFRVLVGRAADGGAPETFTGAPLLPFLYVAVNLCFNISALYLLRGAGSVVVSLAISSILPLTVLSFSYPLPFLGNPAPLGPMFGIGFVVLMLGMWAFNTAPKPRTKAS